MGLYNFKERYVPFILDGSKHQTIRAKRRYPSKPGDTLYLYTGLRTKRARRLMVTTCTRVDEIRIVPRGPGKPAAVFIGDTLITREECDTLAFNDGFRDSGGRGSFAQMIEFFQKRLPFKGDIIYWRIKL